MTFERIIGIVAGSLFLGGYYYWRLHRAGLASQQMASEHAAARALDAQLRTHPAFGRLIQVLASQGIFIAQGPPSPGQYAAAKLTTVDAMGQPADPTQPNALWLNAYLAGPKKLTASLDLRTGQCHVRECGMFEWPPGL